MDRTGGISTVHGDEVVGRDKDGYRNRQRSRKFRSIGGWSGVRELEGCHFSREKEMGGPSRGGDIRGQSDRRQEIRG